MKRTVVSLSDVLIKKCFHKLQFVVVDYFVASKVATWSFLVGCCSEDFSKMICIALLLLSGLTATSSVVSHGQAAAKYVNEFRRTNNPSHNHRHVIDAGSQRITENQSAVKKQREQEGALKHFQDLRSPPKRRKLRFSAGVLEQIPFPELGRKVLKRSAGYDRRASDYLDRSRYRHRAVGRGYNHRVKSYDYGDHKHDTTEREKRSKVKGKKYVHGHRPFRLRSPHRTYHRQRYKQNRHYSY
ncbi:hypothetical protein Y032_0031g2406 [Ancylostoma ceylanicum]|uniref:Uncharacterized protein n=1 Tax=Ancylostoma ceylanicum TaxID=53326 RepID=A0A016UPJ2_9BILA|nr:hypothetical protein Y032_0031g2406 [Ancylostoma ceylanicum]